MKYDVQFTSQFKKDLKLAKKQHKNLDKRTRECHIEPDWLLVYEIKDDVLVLMLYRLGTHSELF